LRVLRSSTLRLSVCVLAAALFGLAHGIAARAAAVDAPTGPSAISLASSVALSWQPVVGATGYSVYRGTTPTTITTAVTPAGGTLGTTFTDTTAANGTTYYYAVRSVVGGIGGTESANSLTVQATPVARSCSTGNTIVVENCFAGTASWNVRSTAQMPAGIEGYATAQSVDKGNPLTLKVSSAAAFNVEIYRTGYYGGAEARLYSIIRSVPASPQPACATDGNTGLTDCGNWSPSAVISTSSAWPSGVYVARIVRTDNSNDNQILFVVRDDARKADVVYGAGMTTFQAYNNYGGRSLYDFNSFGGNTVAGTPRAVAVSFDRPFEQPRSGLRDWYTRTEIATVAWLERMGYDTRYISDGDLETSPTYLNNAKVYVSPAHEEYVSAGMRQAMLNARDAGVGLFFSGSNEIYWKIRFSASPSTGAPNRIQTCYKSVQSGPVDPSGISTSTWRDPNGANAPENALTGEMYIGDNDTTYFPFVVNAAQGADRIYRYTGLDQLAPGSSQAIGGNLTGWEWDARVANGAEPAGVKTLSSSPVNGELIQGNGATYLLNQNTSVSMVKYRAPSGALVVTTGTNHWNRGLANNADGVGEPNLAIQQTTTNILADMGALPATPMTGVVLDPQPGSSPAPPTGVTATPSGSDSVTISWQPVPGTVTYNVYRLNAPRDSGYPLGTKVNFAPLTGTSTTDIELASGTTYYYVVTTTSGGIEGAPSSQASAQTTTVFSQPIRINSGGAAYTARTGATFAADGSVTGGQTNSITQAVTGTNDPTLYQNERWGQFTYSIAVPNGTYDVRMHFAELYYGTSVAGSCVGKRIFSMDVLNTTVSPDIKNLDVCAAAGGARIALVRTVSAVQVTNGTLQVKSVYGSVDDPEITAIEVVPATSTPTPPTVTSTTPAAGATGVATNVQPTAVFSRSMDATTINAANVTLAASGTPVPASVSYNATTATATIAPTAALTPSTAYTATISTAVKASDGLALASPVSWSFTTAAAPDTQPPTAPSSLTATVSAISTVNLSWGASTDNVGVTRYDVYRSQTTGFTPAPTNRIAQVTSGTTYTDTGLATGTYFYKVQAEDAAANLSASSNEATATVTGDTTPPTVSLTAPANGATVSGSTTVSANASDDVGVVGVQFKLDGSNLGAEDTTSPYSVTWDTTAVANGSHTLTAVARDAAGHTTTATTASVTVSNTAPPPATFLFGDQTVEPSSDFNPAGVAEAFRTTAANGGTATEIDVYVDTGSSATALVAGLYADNANHPGALLAQGTLSAPKSAAWNAVKIPSTAITNGSSYWIGLLGTGGQLKFRDRCCGTGSAVEASSQQTLTTFPATWTTGATYKDGPAAAYVSGTNSTLPAADQVGRWSAPVQWPLVAVHMSLLPTGNVIAFDGFDAAPNSERIWNPATGNFTPVPYARNLFCAGHVLLPDGRTLIVGGHVQADVGLADTTLFNSSTNTYQRAGDMTVGRWYPTATEMGNGKVFVFSGDNIVQDQTGKTPPFTDSSVNSLPEVFDPQTNTWQDLTSSRLTSPLYPQIFQLSDGRLIDVGPDTTTRTITPGTWQWQTLTTSPFDGMSSVMYLPDKIMKAGTWADPDFKGPLTYQAGARTAVLDMTQQNPTWRETSPMSFPRSYQNLTLLPDGNVLASGGMTDSDGVDLTKAVLPAEIWSPTTEKWTTMASLANGREYHSTAILLPDGRVLMAGGGQLPGSGAVDQTNAEIFSPPYLFKGARPTITAAPGTVQYGSQFTVTTPDAASITKVALIRTPSVTHAFDQNGRYIPVSFTTGNGQLTVQAPSSSNTAPPGYYMLFILNGSGVPSVASFVRFPAAWEDSQAPTAPGTLSATAGTGSVALSWSAATDNVGVTSYDVYRSTTSGFTPSPSNKIGSSTTTTYTDNGVAPGTYFYVVRAEDAAGNIGPPTNETTATLAPDSTPPTVSVTAPAAGATVSGATVTLSANASDNVGVSGVTFKVDGTTVGSQDTTSPYSVAWDSTTVANGTHTVTAVAADAAGNTTTSAGVSVTVSNTAPPTLIFLAGDQAIEPKVDFNNEGLAEASKAVASATGTLSQTSVYIDSTSTSTSIIVGIYSDSAGHPGTLLSSGTLTLPKGGAWNNVTLPATTLTAGQTYWLALLSPVGSGTVKFRDRCCGGGGAMEASAQANLTALPTTWSRGSTFADGPFSFYASGH
jgi:Malectin domain/Domain of unknown function (DUF1929)/Bacterial Ig-like domain/Bacterial Ig domain